jgi:hypothetical protein
MKLYFLTLSFLVFAQIHASGEVTSKDVDRVFPVMIADSLKLNLLLQPHTVEGYAVSYERTDRGMLVTCEEDLSKICYRYNYETGTGCIDPDGCNPEIGPTYFPVREVDGVYYEIITNNGEYVTYLIYTPPGWQKEGG